MLMQTPRSAFAASQPAAPAPMADLFDAFNLMGSQMTLGPNEEIFGEKEPAEYVYKVVSGAVRTYTILKDGRRQIKQHLLVVHHKNGDWRFRTVVGFGLAHQSGQVSGKHPFDASRKHV